MVFSLLYSMTKLVHHTMKIVAAAVSYIKSVAYFEFRRFEMFETFNLVYLQILFKDLFYN